MDANDSAVRSCGRRARGWWIPYTFVAGFAVVLIANGTMLYFATSTFSGLSTTKAYLEGLAYNQKVAAEEAQEALGWTWHIDLADIAAAPSPTAADGRAATLRLLGQDAEGRPLDGVTMSALVRRPTEQGLDQTVDFRPVGPGRYEARITLPKPGQWDLLFTARRGDDTFKLRRRLRTD